MRFLRRLLAATAMLTLTAAAQAAGPGYTTLQTPVRTESGKKVEVVEFFMYTCPHCNVLDPLLSEWVKKQGDRIAFRRVHFAQSPTDPLAHLYVTLEAMGQQDQVHSRIFNQIHVQRDRALFRSDDALKDFVVKNGIDKAKYEQYFNSFAVQTKLKRLPAIVASYKVESAPTIVVDGRYVTSPAQAGAPGTTEVAAGRATLAVLDTLVDKAAAGRK